MAKKPELLEPWKSRGLTGKSQSRSNARQNFIPQIWIDKIPCGIEMRTNRGGAEPKHPPAWERGSRIAASTPFLRVSNKSTEVYLLIISISGQKKIL